MCFVDQAILDKAGTVTKHVSHVVFPAFSLNRGEGCEIPENAYWGLQTYLGLREKPPTRALGASSTSRRVSERHSGTVIANRFVTSLSSKSARCTVDGQLGIHVTGRLRQRHAESKRC